MTPLQSFITQLIKKGGPISIADYMSLAVAHPDWGYYRTAAVLGRGGDFVTAPEISQVFGELIGLWALDLWRRWGAPQPFNLIELGPGRGTLLADALRATRIDPAFTSAMQLHLLEMSEPLKAEQAKNLQGFDPVWHEEITTLPAGPAIIIANEFFDCLPIRQYEKAPEGWHERLVGLKGDRDDNGALSFALDRSLAALPGYDASAWPEGAVLEISRAAQAIMGDLSRQLAAHGGAMLVIDYGDSKPSGKGSLQAIKAHAFHPPLQDPGTADLTAHVNFAALAGEAARAGAQLHGPVTQGAFLKTLGIDARAQTLAQARPDKTHDITAGTERLSDEAQMGSLFKVLAITGKDTPAPAGF